MGLLVKGKWHDQWYDTGTSKGQFIREDSQFRDWVSADADAEFAAEAGRYHLYVSLACPWAHRTLIFRALKNLEDIVSVSVVHPDMMEQGWVYPLDGEGGTPDQVNAVQYHHQLYTLAQADYTGRVTVPVLWDKKTSRIVNNESSDIIRMFNSGFNGLASDPASDLVRDKADYYPLALRDDIDAVNELVYEAINNGVYRCGFATTQQAYEEAFDALFAALDELEKRLSHQRYLVGASLTEADWRLFTTLIRFDAVYYGHFKCNLRRIADYPNLSNYLRELYQYPGVRDTVDFWHIKRHYYFSHDMINPTRIVPKGPALDYDAVHDRGRFDQEPS